MEERQDWKFLGIGIALLCASWGWLLYQAHHYWGSESYYNFGWFVPVLAVYALHRRLKASRSARDPQAGSSVWLLLVPGLLAAVAGVAFFRLFNEANPFWRIPLWGHAAVLLGFTAFALLLAGGRNGFRQLIYPVLFLLLALPWPWRFEQWVIHSFTGWITNITVVMLNLAGYPATSAGNVIQINEIRLGVEEACSGIRSLQALVMMAVFIGEYYTFGLIRRLALLAACLVLVITFNTVRSLALAFITVGDGGDSFQFWHDFLGNFNFIGCAVLLFLLGEGLSRSSRAVAAVPCRINWRLPGRRPMILAACLTGAGFSLAELAVEGYFRFQEARNPPLPQLSVNWDRANSVQHRISEIPPAIAEALKFDFGKRINLTWDNGLTAAVTHYGYTGEDRIASVSSFGHTPEICVTAVGGQLVAQKAPLPIPIDGYTWNFQHFEFRFDAAGGRPAALQVFWLVWEPQQMGVAASELESLTWGSQWHLVVNGRRNFARQVLLIQFTAERSDQVLREYVRRLVMQVTAKPMPAGDAAS